MRTGQFRLSVLACRKVDWSTDPPKSFNMSYTKAGLESMSQEEFFSLAEKLEIPDYKKREKIDVIYDIIEKSVSESVANSANKEKTPRKRARLASARYSGTFDTNTPPSPNDVQFLTSCIEKHPKCPIVPSLRPLYSPPKPCAASSITTMSRFFATFMIASMSQG